MNNIFEKAQCIWSSDSKEPNQYAYFKQSFRLHEKSDSVLKISTDSKCCIYINGKIIDAQQYTDYPFYKTYDCVDIPSELLKKGENELLILSYCQNESSFSYCKGFPFIIFELMQGGEIVAFSDEDTKANVHTGFKNGDMELFSRQLSFSFSFDQNNIKEMWHKSVRTESPEHFYERPIKQLAVGERENTAVLACGIFKNSEISEKISKKMQYSFLKYQPLFKNQLPCEEGILFETKEGCDGIYVIIDMKKEQSGYFEIEFEAEDAAKTEVGFGEHLDDLRVRSDMGGGGFAFDLTTLKGKNAFSMRLKRIAGRYLQIHFYSKKITLYYAGVRSADYPVKMLGNPKNLNFLQKKIYDVGIDTLKRCMHEHYEDCPLREQALYAMDSRNQMLCGYEAFGEAEFAKASIRLLGMGIRYDGLLTLCAPAEIPETIPSFSLIWVIALKEYVEFSKDTKFATEMQPYFEKIMSTFIGYMKGDLLHNPQGYWGFYEWNEYMDGVDWKRNIQITRDGFDSPLNAYFAMALLSVQYLYEKIGKANKAEEISDLYSRLKEAYQKEFFICEKQAYCVSSVDDECKNVFPELAQALTVLAGLCKNEEVKQKLISQMLGDAFYPKTSLSHLMFVYEAMLQDSNLHGRILENMETIWGEMLFKGATTFWETEKGASDFGGAGSLCHGWSAAPVFVYHKIFK